MLELKKSLTKVLLLACIVLVFAALSGCGEDKPILNVYNWGDYIDEGVLELFEEQTGIKVVYSTFEMNEDMYTKIKSSQGDSYDVIIPSDYMIIKMKNEGMLAKIDKSKLSNYDLIDKTFEENTYDSGNEYSVPYMWGTVGIVYNTEMVKEKVDSWSILWDEKYSGQIFMMDSVRDSIGITLKLLGYSLNSTNDAELEAAKQKLIEQKPLVISYTGDQVKDQMIAGEGALAVVYSGDAITIREKNENIEYAVPKEGSNIWVDAMCILESSPHKEEAHKFIDFMCSTEIAVKNREYINYSTPQSEVYEELPDEIKNDPTQYPSDEVIARCEYFDDPSDKISKYDTIWTEVLAN